MADAGYRRRMHWMDLEEGVMLANLISCIRKLSAEEMQEVLLRSAERIRPLCGSHAFTLGILLCGKKTPGRLAHYSKASSISSLHFHLHT